MLAEPLFPLIDKNNPVGDVRGMKHHFVDSSKTCVIDMAQASRNGTTHRFQAPLSGFFIEEYQQFCHQRKVGDTYYGGLLGCWAIS